jgi:hypothetical protein
MIAPVLLLGRGLFPPKKAKHGVGSCSNVSFKQLAVNCKVVAAVRLGRQQPGILWRKKYPDPSINYLYEINCLDAVMKTLGI